MDVISKKTNYILLLPVCGILLFTALYILAASRYPGGSNVNKHSEGFNMFTNYWCDLLAPTGKNGQLNRGRKPAVMAMMILSFALSFFWYAFPWLFNTSHSKATLLRICGIGSMFTILFLVTSFHDIVINIAGTLGLIALLIVYNELYRNRSFKLFAMGMVCLLLFLLNNYIYFTGRFLIHLPVIQKISFVFLLLWIAWMNLKLFSKYRHLRLK